MLQSRPVIFISAVTRELRTTRDLVAKTLIALGYDPKWQDIAATDSGDLKGVLRRWLDSSHAVLQIVGHRYGYEPGEPDATFGQVSYTQYEALYARSKGKKVWYIILDELHPVDCPDDEPEELKKLQADYRIQVKAHHGLYHLSDAALTTENIVLKLRDDLAKLRSRAKTWTLFVTGALLTIAAAVNWNVLLQGEAGEKLEEIEKLTASTDEKVDSVITRYRQMEQALVSLADAESRARFSDEKLSRDETRARAYSILEQELGIPEGVLSKELPGFALELYSRPDTSLLMRARAAYALSIFDEAEKLFLESAEQDEQAQNNAERIAAEVMGRRIEALVGAGNAAREQIRYKRALEHYRAAAALISPEFDIIGWAEIRNEIGWLMYLDGQYASQEALMREVCRAGEKAGSTEESTWLESRMLLSSALASQGKYTEAEREQRAVLEIQERVLGAEHPDTLTSRNNLGLILESEGKYAEAESEHRAVLEIRERIHGSEHKSTLMSRHSLASALHFLGKHAEAERQSRAVLEIWERVLGPENPNTLASRNNLANALHSQGKHAEAEGEFRVVLAIMENVLGAEHPNTLKSRNNLALSLRSQGKHEEAEGVHRSVLAIFERILGPEHPETLVSRMNLANTLRSQGKYTEAEREQRAVLEIQERVLGAEHPDTLGSRSNLASALGYQGKHEEAEREHRAVLSIRERVLGPEHPDTLTSRNNLASALYSQGKHAEAEKEHRAVLSIRERVLGPEHPKTLTSRNNLASALDSAGKHGEAEKEQRAVLAIQERIFGSEHPDTLTSCYNLSLCLEQQGRAEEALGFARRAWEGWRKVLGEDHPHTQAAKRQVEGE